MDPRIPIRLAGAYTPGPARAALLEGADPPPNTPGRRFDLTAHAQGCACCLPRSQVSNALNSLFIERARGGPYFTELMAVPASFAGRQAILAALATDPLISARFRLADTPQ